VRLARLCLKDVNPDLASWSATSWGEACPRMTREVGQFFEREGEQLCEARQIGREHVHKQFSILR
jgi:hypothetical protein